MIPLAAELVVGHHDQRPARLGARLHGPDEIDQVLLAVVGAGVPGVLVLRAVRLDEAHRGKGAGASGGEEVQLVA